MRVAEIYLINAEAKAHLNDPDAINKLNDLKQPEGKNHSYKSFTTGSIGNYLARTPQRIMGKDSV